MQYNVTKQFGSNREVPDKHFTKIDEAKAYVQQSAEHDASMRINTIYRIYEFDDVVYEVNSAKLDPHKPADSSSSSTGKGSGATFSPTPFAMSAKPKGAVQHWKNDPEEDKKDK